MASNRRAKFLPDTLAQRYVEAVHDPELLNLREDLGLIEIRLSQLLSKIETSDPKEKWIEFRGIVNSLLDALKDGDEGKVALYSVLLDKRVGEKLEDYAVWEEITQMIENRRRVTESESNRLVRMQQMLNAEDAMRLIETLLSAVKRHVKDPQAYAAIAYEFAIATGAAHNGLLERGGKEVQPDELDRVDQGKLLGPRTQGSDPSG